MAEDAGEETSELFPTSSKPASPPTEPAPSYFETAPPSGPPSKTLQAPAPISLETASGITDQTHSTSSVAEEVKKQNIEGLKKSCIRDNCDNISGVSGGVRKQRCINNCGKKAMKIINIL